MDRMTALHPKPHSATRPLLPAESPLAMPAQSFDTAEPAAARLAGTPLDMVWRRLFVLGGTAGLTLLATYQLWWAMRPGGHGALECLSLLLFASLFVWVAQGVMSALVGSAQSARCCR